MNLQGRRCTYKCNAGERSRSNFCHGKAINMSYYRPHYGPGVDSASNRNEYQAYFLGVKAAGE